MTAPSDRWGAWVGGAALPDPPAGGGDGGTRFPHPSPRALPCQTRPQAGGMGEPGSPTPLRGLCPAGPAHGPGRGETRFPLACLRALPYQTLPRAGGWGNPVPPPLSEGFALSNSPAGGGMGEPGSPIPSPRALPYQTLPRAGGWGNPVPPPLSEGFALPDPPAGGGMGEPGSPTSLRGLCPAGPARRRGDGGTRFPHAHEQGPEVQETLPALHLTHGERKEINYRLLRFRSRRASRRPVVATGRGATGAVSPAVTRGAARGPRPLVAAARSRPGSTLRM